LDSALVPQSRGSILGAIEDTVIGPDPRRRKRLVGFLRSHQMRVRSLLGSSVVATALLLATNNASASGYLSARFGGDHGTPAMPNGYAIYFNPAALGGTEGTAITGDLAVLLRYASYERPTSSLSPSSEGAAKVPGYVEANSGKATVTNLLALPFLSFNTDFGSKWFRAGFASYVPFGGFANWSRGDASAFPNAPGAVDGPQRWHNISGQLLAWYNTVAVAAKLGDTGLSLGLSGSAIVHSIKTVRARNLDGSDDTAGLTGRGKEGRSYLAVHGLNFGFGAGLYYEPEDKKFRLGLSYMSQPGLGETKMSGTVTQILEGSAGSETDAELTQTYPDIWRLGMAHRMSKKFELRGDFEYVRWSTFDRQCVVQKGAKCELDANSGSPDGKIILNIPRKFKDAFGARIGPAYFVNDDLELFGSLGLTTPAVPKETIDSSTIDALRFYLAVGAKYELSKHVGLAASYNHIAFMNVTTNRGQQNNFSNPSKSPNASGTYASQIGFVNVNMTYTF
jgi:long-chain fatty acid transport protein